MLEANKNYSALFIGLAVFLIGVGLGIDSSIKTFPSILFMGSGVVSGLLALILAVGERHLLKLSNETDNIEELKKVGYSFCKDERFMTMNFQGSDVYILTPIRGKTWGIDVLVRDNQQQRKVSVEYFHVTKDEDGTIYWIVTKDRRLYRQEDILSLESIQDVAHTLVNNVKFGWE